MLDFLRSIPGLQVEAGAMTVDDLRRAVDGKVAVILDLQAWSDEADYRTIWDSGHYVVLSGYEGNVFLFSDPSADDTAYLEMAEVSDRWHDEDIDGDRWGNLGISISLDSLLRDDPSWKTFAETKMKNLAEKTAALRVADRYQALRVARRFAGEGGERVLELNLRPLLQLRQKGNPIEADRCGEIDGKMVCGEDFEYYEALMRSMRLRGIGEPIHIAAWGGRPKLVEGHHRLSAAWELGWKKILTRVDGSISDETLRELGLA